MTTFAIINSTQTQNPEIRIYLNPNADDIDSITDFKIAEVLMKNI